MTRNYAVASSNFCKLENHGAVLKNSVNFFFPSFLFHVKISIVIFLIEMNEKENVWFQISYKLVLFNRNFRMLSIIISDQTNNSIKNCFVIRSFAIFHSICNRGIHDVITLYTNHDKK